MATYTFDKIDYGGNTYVVSDSGALQLTGGQVTGPVTFGDSVSIDEATLGDLVVNGSASFTNNIQANTINGVTVGSSPKFTDTNTEVSTLTLVAGSTAGTSLTSGGKFTLTAGSKTVSFTMPTIPSVPSNIVNTITTTAGTHTAITSKKGNVSFNVPTKTSHLTNDSGFLTSITHQTIKQDGVTGATGNHFGTCSVAAGTAAKTVSITAGTPTLEAGLRVTVKFANANTAGTPTLNVNSLGAKNIFHKGAQITTGANKALLAGTVEFVYDGTQWHLVGNYIDTDTKAWSSITGKPTATGSNTTGITASTTATKTTLGTANSIYGVQSTTTTASKASGSNGTASSWTFAKQVVVVNIEGYIDENEDTLVIGPVVTPIQSKTGGSNGTAPTWSFTDVTVPIKNSSTTSIPNVSVASATVSITDNGHTHSIS